MKKPSPISAYKDAANQAVKDLTTPEQLVHQLFDKSCLLLRTGLDYLDKGEDELFQQVSLHALQIVLSLRFVLDTSGSNPLAMNFYNTYTSIAASLVRTRTNKDKNSLEKIYRAMDELRMAWKAVAEKKS